MGCAGRQITVGDSSPGTQNSSAIQRAPSDSVRSQIPRCFVQESQAERGTPLPAQPQLPRCCLANSVTTSPPRAQGQGRSPSAMQTGQHDKHFLPQHLSPLPASPVSGKASRCCKRTGQSFRSMCSPSQAVHAPTSRHDRQNKGTGGTAEVSQNRDS